MKTIIAGALCLISASVFAVEAIPQYKDYPANIYSGKTAPLKVNNETSRMFKSRLQDGLRHNKVAFAGEYALVSWGCGIGGCVEHTFVSKKTGQVIEENIVGGEIGGSLEGYKPDSRLLVTRHYIYDENTGSDKYELRFYELNNGKFSLIKSKSLPWSKRQLRRFFLRWNN